MTRTQLAEQLRQKIRERERFRLKCSQGWTTRALDSGGSRSGIQHLPPHDPPESNALGRLGFF